MYGIDMEGPQIWHLDRNDITFETLIKTGQFANIYKAKLNDRRKSQAVAVKTLKGCIIVVQDDSIK